MHRSQNQHDLQETQRRRCHRWGCLYPLAHSKGCSHLSSPCCLHPPSGPGFCWWTGPPLPCRRSACWTAWLRLPSASAGCLGSAVGGTRRSPLLHQCQWLGWPWSGQRWLPCWCCRCCRFLSGRASLVASWCSGNHWQCSGQVWVSGWFSLWLKWLRWLVGHTHLQFHRTKVFGSWLGESDTPTTWCNDAVDTDGAT